MPDDATQQDAAQAPSVIVSSALRQRDPAFFSGTDDYDVEDWLTSFERVSAHNKWDDATKLRSVLFYLTHVANLWFRNHESDFANWTAFKTSFAEVFGRPAVRKLRAEQRLRGRAQQQGENFTSYIEDVIDLCKRVNPSMIEQDRIKHIMKGIDDDAFQMLLAKDPRTVSELVTLCQSFDELRKQRVLARRQTSTDDSLAALTIGGDHTALLSQIKELVREEVARQLSFFPTTQVPTPRLTPTIRQVIQEQVTEALPSAFQPTGVTAPLSFVVPSAAPPAPVAAPLTYADAVMKPRPQPVLTPQPPIRPPATVLFGAQPQYANPWRTADNRPICYACGIPGHVARFCRRRFAATTSTPRYPDYSFRPPYRTQPEREPETCARDHQPTSDAQPFAARRSPSPRRRSLSPMRRRYNTGEAEN